MKRTNIYAITPCELQPPYFSVNQEEDGQISFHVRSSVYPEGHPWAGKQTEASFFMGLDDLADLRDSLDEYIRNRVIIGLQKANSA